MSHLITIQSLLYTSKGLLDQDIGELQKVHGDAVEIARLVSLKHMLDQVAGLFTASNKDDQIKHATFALQNLRDAAGIPQKIVVLDEAIKPTADEIQKAEAILASAKAIKGE